MRVEYRDEVLRRLAEEIDFSPKEWSRDVIKAYRKKIQFLVAAKDERDLGALPGVRLEQIHGDRDGQSSIRLNDQFRLIVRFKTDGDRVAVPLELVDYPLERRS